MAYSFEFARILAEISNLPAEELGSDEAKQLFQDLRAHGPQGFATIVINPTELTPR